MLLPYSPVDPRDRKATWHAKDARPARPERETYVLVIGESVRADRLRACGGLRVTAPDALVACDMVAGSSSTHTSVPLLVSRTAAGGMFRVPSDATFMRAFEEVGFRTTWISVQEQSIAWPDAQQSRYVMEHTADVERLLPPLEQALRTGGPRQLIVLHTYDAHFRYCDRYPHPGASPVDCASRTALPTPASREAWLASYDAAVQEAMNLVGSVIQRVSQEGGETFVAYVPDHGENLLDDGRGLFQHALKEPTRWDTRVPFIVWANGEWRTRHAGEWSHLQAIRTARLVHGDVVPTLLGAAGIAYEETRRDVADLTRQMPPAKRMRPVLRRVGEVVDGDAL
jgi:glucan phosphoethanolaminetransferase (alkaline phosphatase superfamily)